MSTDAEIINTWRGIEDRLRDGWGNDPQCWRADALAARYDLLQTRIDLAEAETSLIDANSDLAAMRTMLTPAEALAEVPA
jgi:Mlc titration factor MtfA (ptsG expression regulator)